MRRGLAILVTLLTLGCASFGGVSDGTSVSWGSGNGGRLLAPVELPAEGDGYRIPGLWANRGLRYGTEELVGTIVRAARRVRAEHPGSMLYVGDLSLPQGGRSAHHRSHQSGRDVDLMFYGILPDGRSMPLPTAMPNYGVEGECRSQGVPGLRLDLVRNWTLVRALLEDPVAEVQYIFVQDDIKHLLLAHAVSAGEPTELILAAAEVMHQPGDSAPHDDHFHVRLYCAPSDRVLGCDDRGPARWLKKGQKYVRRLAGPVPAAALAVADALTTRAFLGGLSSVYLALR